MDSFTQGADNGLTFADMFDVEFDDDETWNKFLDQLTAEEMASIMPDSNGSVALDKVTMPASYRGDDMDQLEQVHFKLTDQSGYLWPSIMLSASSWDREQQAERARLTANEAYFMGCTEIWSGGPNIHRTPFNGRATAYYSEDGMVGYYLGQVQAEECQKLGIILGLKHLCVNDQEAMRESAATFTNEQALRENYLRAFEGAYAKGGAQGLMTAFNRMGTTYCGSCKELLTTVLREEWGAHVTVCSDAVVGADYKKHYASNLAAGMDYWCWDMAGFGPAAEAAPSNLSKDVIPQLIAEGDGYMLDRLRNATNHHVYAEVRSIMVNGLSSNARSNTSRRGGKTPSRAPRWAPACLRRASRACMRLPLPGTRTARAPTRLQEREGASSMANDTLARKRLTSYLNLVNAVLLVVTAVVYFIEASAAKTFSSTVLALIVVAAALAVVFALVPGKASDAANLVAVPCIAAALAQFLINSINTIADAVSGITMFGSTGGIGYIVLVAGLLAAAMIIEIVSCFMSREAK